MRFSDPYTDNIICETGLKYNTPNRYFPDTVSDQWKLSDLFSPLVTQSHNTLLDVSCPSVQAISRPA